MGKTKPAGDVFQVYRTRLDGLRHLLQGMDPEAAETIIRMLIEARRVFLTGKGRSGLIAECFAMRLMQMGFDVHVPGEATCPRIGQDDLLVAVSCSGATVTTCELARIASEAGAQVAAFTADPESRLARLAQHVVCVPVTADDVKKSYRYVLGPYNNTQFEEAVLLYSDALLYAILEREGIPENLLDERHANLQ